MTQLNTLLLKKHFDGKRILNTYLPTIMDILLITTGSIIWVIGMNGVLIPNQFLSGGLVGIALLIHYLTSAIKIEYIFLILNLPLMILGWRTISRHFMVYSIFGMGTFTIITHVIKPNPVTIEDPILAALFAGVVCGTGAGLILRSRGSCGGLDILGIYFKKRFGIQIGTTLTICNSLILLAGVYFYSLQMALYSLIFLFTTGKVMNAVISGFNRRKAVLIVSDQSEIIAEALLREEKRGATFLKGEGGFSHQEKNIILTVISMIELAKIKEIVLNLDPNAFVIVNDTLEVMGKRLAKGFLY